MTTRPSHRLPRQSGPRANFEAVPLFTADEAWRRRAADRPVASEMDDRDSLLEPGFWMPALVAFLPTLAGGLYLFLTQG